MGSYEALRSEMEEIHWVDAHSHVLHWNIVPPASEGPYPVLPLTRLLLDFNLRPLWQSAGLGQERVASLLAGQVPPPEQKAVLLGQPGLRTTSAYALLMGGLRTLHGLSGELNEESWDGVDASLRLSREDFYGLLDRTYTAGNIRKSVLNLWADRGYTYVGPYRDRLTGEEREADRRLFLFAATLDFHALTPFSPLALRYGELFGMGQDSLAEYDALLCRAARYLVEEKGARAFKISEMYFRKLDYAVTDASRAAACYKRERSPGENKILGDYTACRVFELAARYDIPVQIHTGLCWGDTRLEQVSPLPLQEAIRAFPDTRFDLLHGGEPFFTDSLVLAESYPNVTLNLAAMPVHSPEHCSQRLGYFLDRLPCNKLSLGWDVFSPELVAGAADLSRDMLASVLARRVDMGLYSLETALTAAHFLMHGTAERLYDTKRG